MFSFFSLCRHAQRYETPRVERSAFEAEGRRVEYGPRTRNSGPASEPLYKEAKTLKATRGAAGHPASSWGAELEPNEANTAAKVETDMKQGTDG